MSHRSPNNSIQDLQRRWGSQSIYRYGDFSTPPSLRVIPTGTAELDTKLGIGGIPQQGITELIGQPTSGMTSLAFQIAHEAQQKGYPVVYADLAYHFDADAAAQFDLDWQRLCLITPSDPQQSLIILEDFISSGSAGLVVVDGIATWLTQYGSTSLWKNWTLRISQRLAKVTTACLILNDGLPRSVEQAWVRLHFKRKTWLYEQTELVGYTTQITIQKNKFAPLQAPVTLTLAIASEDF